MLFDIVQVCVKKESLSRWSSGLGFDSRVGQSITGLCLNFVSVVARSLEVCPV